MTFEKLAAPIVNQSIRFLGVQMAYVPPGQGWPDLTDPSDTVEYKPFTAIFASNQTSVDEFGNPYVRTDQPNIKVRNDVVSEIRGEGQGNNIFRRGDRIVLLEPGPVQDKMKIPTRYVVVNIFKDNTLTTTYDLEVGDDSDLRC